MTEGLNFEGIKKVLKMKFEKVKGFVEAEQERLSNGAKAPYVSENCPERYRELAERLVAIQALNGEITAADIDKKDINKIKDMTKLKAGLSFRDNISMMVANAYYVDYDVVNARHILRFLVEFQDIYNKFYASNGAIPLNAFSNETRLFIKNMKSGLSKEEVMRAILEVYLPEFANIEMEHHNYDLVPRQAISEAEIQRIVAELDSIAVNKNLDAIFSTKYEPYFKKLCERLKQSGYTFDSFITKHTDFNYTMCFKADILKAVKQMCLSYKDRRGTTVGIQSKDPYLYTKIDLAKEIVGVYTISEILESLGIESDNYDTSSHTLSEPEIAAREKKLFEEFDKLFPDKFIPLKFQLHKKGIYEELLFLARRRKFANVNDYLASKGFSRDLNYNAKVNRNMFLSERDVQFYDFLKGCPSPEAAEAWLKEKGLELADPYVSFGIYKKLAYEKIDCVSKLVDDDVLSSNKTGGSMN